MTVATIIKRIEDGQPYRIDYEKKVAKLNGFVVDIEFEHSGDREEKLLELFRNYKYSVPNTHSNSKYFFGLDESHLSTKQLAENESRYIARAKLELYVLGLIVNHEWDFGNEWYWQSKEEPKLVLFKKWF